MRTLITISTILSCLTLSHGASVDSVTVDSVWNSDSSWNDGNGVSQQRLSRDCSLSFIPQDSGYVSCSLSVSLDSGKTWDASPNPLQVLNSGLDNPFKCGIKGHVLARIVGSDRPSVVIKVRASNCVHAATAMTLVSPVGGQTFSFTDTIIVKWIANPDSLGNQPLRAFTREYSLDSGKSWIRMTSPPASYIDNGDDIYQQTWIGLDTNEIDPITYQPLTNKDFLNKGVLVHVLSYPPNIISRQSGFIFFHN